MSTNKHFLDNEGLRYAWSKIKALVAGKVDKVEGKGLSTNDYTNEEKTKLEGLSNYTLEPASADKLGGVKVGSGINVDADGAISVTPYTLPTATTDVVGGVKVGSGITLGEDGAISVTPYTLGSATADALGGVKVGEGLTVADDGKLSVNSSILEMDWVKIKNKPEIVVKDDIINVYKYVGSVANEAALPVSTDENPIAPGSVYNLESTGMNVAWTGEEWDALGISLNMDPITNTEIDEILV